MSVRDEWRKARLRLWAGRDPLAVVTIVLVIAVVGYLALLSIGWPYR